MTDKRSAIVLAVESLRLTLRCIQLECLLYSSGWHFEHAAVVGMLNTFKMQTTCTCTLRFAIIATGICGLDSLPKPVDSGIERQGNGQDVRNTWYGGLAARLAGCPAAGRLRTWCATGTGKANNMHEWLQADM